jgi:inositol transport system ATP-binding protein
MGSGRTNVAETLFGITPSDGGQIELDGKPVRISDPHMAIEKGFALLTEDRKLSGLFPCLSVLENMEMAVLPQLFGQRFHPAEGPARPVRRHVQEAAGQDAVPGAMHRHLVRRQPAESLLARWLMTHPRLLILDEPTRGIDVGAKAEIYRLIASRQRRHGGDPDFSELPEVLGMSDRVMVMHEGE